MIINNVARILFFTSPNLQELEEQVDPVASKKIANYTSVSCIF